MAGDVGPQHDFERARRRSQFEAWLLDASAEFVHRQHGDRKARVLGAMRGTVVEIGPGTGANLRYYAPGVKLIGIEPNPAMHDRLRTKAQRHDVDLEIRTIVGERIDLDDASADAVVGTLVLCSVSDPERVLAEVRRVLKPGGTYFFLEHVAAPAGSMTRRVQDVVMRPHRWMFNGCKVNRDTGAALERAGFSSVDLEHADAGLAALYFRTQIVGTATC